jgi:hypothetical protein
MKKSQARRHTRRKKPLRAEVKAQRQAAQERERERQLERRRKVDAEAEAEYQAARAAVAAAVERDQLATVPDFDREWWTSFGLDFFDCQFGEAGEVDGVAYEAHDAHAFEWVRLAEGPHRVVLAIDSRVVHNEDADEAELLLYATTPEALTAIQERAGYPDFAWIDIRASIPT